MRIPSPTCIFSPKTAGVIVTRVALLTIFSLFLSLTVSHAAHAQNILRDAVAIWLFDEGVGEKVSDFTRNNHHGDFNGNPEWVPGKFGTALRFLGADETTWVDINRPAKVNSVDLSIGCWILPSNPQERFQNVLSGRDGWLSEAGIAVEQYENLSNNYRIVIGGVFGGVNLGNPRHAVKLDNNEWTHLAFVREGRNGIWYKNGLPDRQKRGGYYIDTGSIRPARSSDTNFRIGAASWTDWFRYRGVLDEVFIYERALSQEEVQRVMNVGFRGALNADAKGKAATVWGGIKSPR
jgi:hypothetical protein